MAGNRIFRSVVLVGLSVGGCNAKHPAVHSPGHSAEEEGTVKPADSAKRREGAPTQPADPSKSQGNDAADQACPEGSDLPDPPCFYIL